MLWIMYYSYESLSSLVIDENADSTDVFKYHQLNFLFPVAMWLLRL